MLVFRSRFFSRNSVILSFFLLLFVGMSSPLPNSEIWLKLRNLVRAIGLVENGRGLNKLFLSVMTTGIGLSSCFSSLLKERANQCERRNTFGSYSIGFVGWSIFVDEPKVAFRSLSVWLFDSSGRSFKPKLFATWPRWIFFTWNKYFHSRENDA